ncbi:hypothetical protein ACS0TY_017932 [Phlomoides rotata]
MSYFLFPYLLCEEIEKAMARFYWGATPGERKIHGLSWEKISQSKEKGGLGFREINIGDSLITEIPWRSKFCGINISQGAILIRQPWGTNRVTFGVASSMLTILYMRGQLGGLEWGPQFGVGMIDGLARMIYLNRWQTNFLVESHGSPILFTMIQAPGRATSFATFLNPLMWQKSFVSFSAIVGHPT